MTTELTPELQKQIEQEAEDRTARLKDNNDFQAGIIQGNKDGYEAAGEKYATKWQEEKELRERYEKALNKIVNQSYAVGYTGAKWGASEYDSISAVTGYNEALDNVKSIASEALTPKQTTDE